MEKVQSRVLLLTLMLLFSFRERCCLSDSSPKETNMCKINKNFFWSKISPSTVPMVSIHTIFNIGIMSELWMQQNSIFFVGEIFLPTPKDQTDRLWTKILRHMYEVAGWDLTVTVCRNDNASPPATKHTFTTFSWKCIENAPMCRSLPLLCLLRFRPPIYLL